MTTNFLPITLEEGKQYYPMFTQFDLIFVTGDPYYDHPLSGVAILSRLLDKKGFKVGIIAQPTCDQDYQTCGRPKYFFCLTSGLLDSMLANYTPMLHKRENVLVPERALMVYTQKVKQFFPGCLTVLGGVEATIRRFTHFDYATNKLRRGILNDTKADLLLFGNVDRSLLNLLNKIKGIKTEINSKTLELIDLPSLEGAAFRVKKENISPNITHLPSYEECVVDKIKLNTLTRLHFLNPESAFLEPCGLGFIQHNAPSPNLIEPEMDFIYELSFTRQMHPHTKNLDFNQQMVEGLEYSVIIGRGCWGGCSFCVIPLVQGKEIAHRSQESILKEIKNSYERGVRKINDLTLPTLNMFGSRCRLRQTANKIYSPILEQEITIFTKEKSCNQNCIKCPHREINEDLNLLLEEVEKLNRKYVGSYLELRSGFRHDIILNQKKLFRKIMQFTSRLKVAPEHITDSVLKQMNKGTFQDFKEFLKEYHKINQEQGTHKNLVPYFVAAHPGCTTEDMEQLRQFCQENNLYVNLTQIFTPTPGTVSTAMYYTGENPLTKEKVYVPRTFREKKDQKNILLDREPGGDDWNG